MICLLGVLCFNSCKEADSSEKVVWYDIDFDKSECITNYEAWKQNRPHSYFFEYEIGPYEYDKNLFAEVTVTGDTKQVDFFRKEFNYETGKEEKLKIEDYVFKEETESDYYFYFDSIDSLFDKTISWYSKYENDIEDKKLFHAWLFIEYDENRNFISTVNFTVAIRNFSGLIGWDGDDTFRVMVSNFKVLGED